MHIGLAIHFLLTWLQEEQGVGAANPNFDLIDQPKPLVQDFWIELYDNSLLWLALLWLSVILFAGMILFGRSIVPSLLYTGHLANRFSRLQQLFYAGAALGLLLVVTFAVLWFSNMGVLTDIYDRVWY